MKRDFTNVIGYIYKLTSPNVEYKIVFKDGEIDTIKRVKGWKTDIEMAKALGITKQYLSMMRLGKMPVSAYVIAKLACLTGNIEYGWWAPFDIVPRGVYNINHPTWSFEKSLGRVPYSDKSSNQISQSRIHDYPAENQSQNNLEKNVDKSCWML